MPKKPLPLSNTVNRTLARLHGSQEAAQERIKRNQLPSKPKDGSGTVQQRVLILNDLHIGAGRDPVTAKIDPGDDFTAVQTRQLLAYLSREWQAAKTGNPDSTHPTKSRLGEALAGINWADGQPIDFSKLGELTSRPSAYQLTLCINGDFVDFLQAVVERPGTPFPDGYADYGGPKNTPANAIAQLNMIRDGHPEVFRALAVHLRLGHKIDLIPGNHDRHLYNDHVWSGEVEVGGKKLGGFTRIIAEELEKTGASDAEIKDCLARLERKPFAVYGDKWVDHGDMSDRHNRVQRPYGEVFDPTPLHKEMSLALGDYGVRKGFNQFEALNPNLDAIDDKGLFVRSTLRHPLKMAALARGFLSGLQREGYEVSRAADKATRVADMQRLVDKFPFIMESLNAFRPDGEKLTKEQIAKGLGEIEKVSATPLFSNFPKRAKLFERVLKFGLDRFGGSYDMRSKDQITLERGLTAKEHFGVSAVVEGHTHEAREDAYLTDKEEIFRRVNTHTWTSKVGAWGRSGLTWGEEGRGVGVIELGVDKEGKDFASLKLHKVIGEEGWLVASDIYDVVEKKPKKLEKAAEEIHEKAKDVP